MSELLHIY